MTRQVVSANRLADGRVVYLTEGGWTRDITAARSAADKLEAEALLAAAEEAVRRCEVVGPTLIELREQDPVPQRLREWIRDRGPTRETGRLLNDPAEAGADAGGGS